MTGRTNRDIDINVRARDLGASRELDDIADDADRLERPRDVDVSGPGDKARRELERTGDELDQLDGETARVSVEADGLDDINDQLDALPGKAGDAASALSAAFRSPTAGVAALAAGLLVAGDRFADTVEQAAQLSNLTGDTVEDASRLNTVWARTGADTKDLQDVLLQMGGVLADDAELAAQLGINLADGATLGERFVQLVRVLGEQFDDAGQRSIVASRLFGEEGVSQVNALITRVGDLDEALAGVGDASVVDQGDVEDTRRYKQQLAELGEEFKEFGNSVGSVVLPIVVPALSAMNTSMNWLQADATTLGQSLRSLFDGGSAANRRALADAFDEAEAKAAELAPTLIESARSTDEARQAAIAMGLDLHQQNIVVAEWGRANRDAAGDVDTHAAALGGATREAELFAQRLDPLSLAIVAYGERNERITDILEGRWEKAGFALDTYTDKVDEAVTRSQEIAGNLAADRQLLDLADGFDRVREAAAEAAQAQGTDDARQANRDLARAQLRLNDLVLDYAETVGDIPDETLTRITALVDAGQLTAAEQAIDDLTRDRYTSIELDIAEKVRQGFESVTFKVSGSKLPTVTVNNNPPIINVYNPPGTPAAGYDQVRRYNDRNGQRGGVQ